MRKLALTVVPLLFLACGREPVAPASNTRLAQTLAPSFSAGADQSWVHSSFFADNLIFIDCLGENVRFFGEVPFDFHEVTSGAGNFHFQFFFPAVTPNTPQFFGVGQTSGKVFQLKYGDPQMETFHLAAGEVHNFGVHNEVFVAEDGEQLRSDYQLHTTVNANGEVTVSREELSRTCK